MKQIQDYVLQNLLNTEQMTDKIKSGVHFAFSRMGDGEFDCILGDPSNSGGNCDGHEYYKEMGIDLGDIIEWWAEAQPENYYLGLHVSKRIGPQTVNWLEERGINSDFARNCEFHVALVHGKLKEFYKALKSRKVIIVGPKRLQQQTIVDVEDFVNIPETNAWVQSDRIIKEILSKKLKDRIVLFCAGPPAAIFIDEVWQERNDCTLIDFGSTLDPNIGVNSRSFHKKIKQ